jgi:hypothetical protein
MLRFEATTAKRDKKERSSFLSLLICPALSGHPDLKGKSCGKLHERSGLAPQYYGFTAISAGMRYGVWGLAPCTPYSLLIGKPL